MKEYDETLPFYLAAIAFPTDLRKILLKASTNKPENAKEFNACKGILDTIENAMSRYSKKVLEDFIRMPEVSMLLLNYLSKRKNAEYKEHYKMLKEMAEVSLEKYSFTSAPKSYKVEANIFSLI